MSERKYLSENESHPKMQEWSEAIKKIAVKKLKKKKMKLNSP